MGTCWLGGNLNRNVFADKSGIRPGEVIPAVTPLGYEADNPRLLESAVRIIIGAKNRKPFGSLFFSDNDAGQYPENPNDIFYKILQAVRSGPSASNKQPWRIICSDYEYRFYMDEDKNYNSAFKGIKIQNLDIGIAMANFNLAAIELGLSGLWKKGAPALDNENWIPISTWVKK